MGNLVKIYLNVVCFKRNYITVKKKRSVLFGHGFKIFFQIQMDVNNQNWRLGKIFISLNLLFHGLIGKMWFKTMMLNLTTF